MGRQRLHLHGQRQKEPLRHCNSSQLSFGVTAAQLRPAAPLCSTIVFFYCNSLAGEDGVKEAGESLSHCDSLTGDSAMFYGETLILGKMAPFLF